MKNQDRRQFLKKLAVATGGVVIAPIVTSCSGAAQTKEAAQAGSQDAPTPNPQIENGQMLEIPLARPDDWHPIAFNRKRGNDGAIPKSYLDHINGPEGEKKHLGKHLPYIPEVNPALVPDGYIPIMWGDPSLGYAKHPNAPKGAEAYPDGHWYNWVRLRKSTSDEAEESQSIFESWPDEQSKGKYAVMGGGDITSNSGRNTIYLVALPKDVKAGDTVRIHGHCLYHGEYIHFINI